MKKGIWLMVLVIMLCSCVVCAKDTVLTTTVPDTCLLTLNISGEGTVWINGQDYRKTSTIEIKRNQKIKIDMQSKQGWHLDSLLHDGENKISHLVNGIYTFETGNATSEINISFSANPESPKPSPFPLSFVLVAHLLSAGMILFFIKKAKKVTEK